MYTYTYLQEHTMYKSLSKQQKENFTLLKIEKCEVPSFSCTSKVSNSFLGIDMKIIYYRYFLYLWGAIGTKAILLPRKWYISYTTRIFIR